MRHIFIKWLQEAENQYCVEPESFVCVFLCFDMEHINHKDNYEGDWEKKSPSSVQFSSVAQSCPTLCDPMNCSTPGLPVHHQLPEFTQTHVHRVSDAIHPAISSSVVPFSSCPQSLPASESFPMSQLFA